MKITNKYKLLISIILFLFLLFLSTQYIKPLYTYRIQDNEQAINQEISEMVNHPIQIELMKDLDDKRIVLFTIGSQIGEAVLTKGLNNKYKLNSTRHGSNEVIDGIMKTKSGQYIKFSGKNREGISKILTFIDGEKYNLTVSEGEYFISYVPLIKKTEMNFPSGSVWYDKQGNEIIRIGISKDYIL